MYPLIFRALQEKMYVIHKGIEFMSSYEANNIEFSFYQKFYVYGYSLTSLQISTSSHLLSKQRFFYPSKTLPFLSLYFPPSIQSVNKILTTQL